MYFFTKFATIILGIYLRQLSPLSLSMMASRFIVSVGALMLAIAAQCTTLYSTWLNDFGYFSLPQQARIVGKRLIIDNTTDKPLLAIDSMEHDRNASFRFVLQLANRHNSEGRRYGFFESHSGKKRKTDNPEWGVVWNYVDSLNFCSLTLRCSNSCLHDVLDERSMTAEVSITRAGRSSTLLHTSITRGANLYEGDNRVHIVLNESGTTILLGSSKLSTIARLPGQLLVPGGHFGVFAGKAALLSVERMVIHSVHSPINDLATAWTAETLDSHFATSSDPIEGYWDYLDRSLDESSLRLGGRYRIALVKTTSGYDILYIDGAATDAHLWQPFMLKGTLTPTRFLGSYELLWYDSEKKPFDCDVHASIDDALILTLHFPLATSQLRFAKSITKQ